MPVNYGTAYAGVELMAARAARRDACSSTPRRAASGSPRCSCCGTAGAHVIGTASAVQARRDPRAGRTRTRSTTAPRT